jgi:hypothetical protein
MRTLENSRMPSAAEVEKTEVELNAEKGAFK